MTELTGLDIKEMEKLAVDLGEAKFRGGQIFSWIHRGVTDFDEMTNIPAYLREKLRERTLIGMPKVVKVQKSKIDGTRKYLLELSDGNRIESVFMKYKFGNSICVSSQVGCRMGCKFCASGLDGLLRNMEAGEILGQILAVEKDTGEKINHIVIMGTGEPFDNYENVSKFLKLVNNPKGLNIGMRNITVSTCGIVPKIREFAKDFPQINLAISLHHTDDESRSNLMPVNRKYPIGELLAACREYTEKTSRRITFEYTLVKGVNDSKERATALGKLLKGMLCHVNLIPLNAVEETGLKTTDRKGADLFRKQLEDMGIPSTIRRELGDDIDGACGQLRLKAATE